MSFLKFVENKPAEKTRRVGVCNTVTNSQIGEIRWYGGFRKYAFFPGEATVFDAACLKEIADRCEVMTWEHKHSGVPDA